MERLDESQTGRTPRRFRRLLGLILVIAMTLAFLRIALWRRNPVAILKVVDAQSRPIAGATVTPYALRPKPAGGQAGHYRWTKDGQSVPPEAVVTDETGTAIVPYPKFVVERVETGKISVSLKHPRYVSDTHELVVSTSPPSGTPWIWWNRHSLGSSVSNSTATR